MTTFAALALLVVAQALALVLYGLAAFAASRANPVGGRLTAALVVGGIVAACLYDLAAYLVGGNGSTVSRVYLTVCESHPLYLLLAGLVIGVLMGHLDLPQHEK